MASYLKVSTQLLSSTSLDCNSPDIYQYLIFCSASGLSASIFYSLDHGSLVPAACMSGNFYYKLDIVNNVVRSLDC